MVELSFIIAMTTMFIHACTWEGMIFSIINDKLWNLTPKIRKPLFDCPVCMVPYWGSLIIAVFCYRRGEWIDWFSWMMILATAGGVNAFMDSIIKHNESNRTSSDS